MRRRLAASAVATIVLAGPVSSALAGGTTHYVSNLGGAACSDAGRGTSPTDPWCTFAPAARLHFGPGDRLLLARGATWNEELQLQGAGTAKSPVILGAYGTGPRPRILRDDHRGVIPPLQRAVLLTNPSHWEVRDLEVGNAEQGIEAYFDTLGHEGLTFKNIYAHHIRGIWRAGNPNQFENRCSGPDTNTFPGIYYSGGITITGDETIEYTRSDHAIRDIVMDGITGTRNQDTIRVMFCNGAWHSTDGSRGSNVISDVTLRNLDLYKDDGGVVSRVPGCPDGLAVANAQNVYVLNAVLNGEAACHTATGTAAVLLGGVGETTFVNTVIENVPETGSFDETGIDLELNTETFEVRGSLLAGNAGAGMEILTLPFPDRAGQYHEDFRIVGNTFANGQPPLYETLLAHQQGSIGFLVGAAVPSGLIEANASADDPFIFNPVNNTDLSQVSVVGNEAVVRELIFNSVKGFTPGGDRALQGEPPPPAAVEPWRYQHSTDGGASWDALSWDARTSSWRGRGSKAAVIGRFDQTLAPCGGCRVARAFVAPQAGILAIRGNALAPTPLGPQPAAGTVVTISRNGEAVLGPLELRGQGPKGVLTNVDVPVSAGDMVRFELSSRTLSGSSDTVSWTPSASYLVTPCRRLNKPPPPDEEGSFTCA